MEELNQTFFYPQYILRLKHPMYRVNDKILFNFDLNYYSSE